MEKIENPFSPESKPEDLLRLYQEASGANEKDIGAAKKLFGAFTASGKDAFETAKEFRHFLIEHGFEYDDHVFTLQEVLKQKRGNCLGLALLVGALFTERGVPIEYELITNPKDAIYTQDLKLFNEFLRGDHFDYDRPTLPKLSDRAENPLYRFAPLEHPVLILGDKTFETTSLESPEEDPGWSPEAELRISVSGSAVASHVYVDRVKNLFTKKEQVDLDVCRKLCEKALELWPDNREAYSLLWDIAAEKQDPNLQQEALKEYARIGGDDSRFHFRMYEMTHEISHLEKALSCSPSYILAFFEKNVVQSRDNRDARFHFAVAAWCIANSSIFSLETFYRAHKDRLERLYGKGTLKDLGVSRGKS